MVDAWLPTTCPTLLARLRHDPSNEAAWDEFVEHYGRHIYRWCRQWRLQDADAEDVAQEILLKLARKLRDFAYDPEEQFPRVAQNGCPSRLAGFCRRPAPRLGRSPTSTSGSCCNPSKRAKTSSRSWRRPSIYELLEAAKVQVRLRVAPHTWEAFRLVAIEGLPVAEVAAKVHMQVAMVYVAKSKVQKMLQEEIQKLEAIA